MPLPIAPTNMKHLRGKHKKCGRCFHKKVQTLLGYISKNLNKREQDLVQGWKTQYFLKIC